ncbi:MULTISPECIES: hypothetical protein [unclassified Treponema]|uniref:hypothetical protein n=1 Tax=unclassified Treponema TaxID=2638727 RepID=UPI0020A54738|nr:MULTISPECIES: hypothetical protein [unclassified Treponema]UTC67012.1 hypothetical protein E4O06_13900 [Treponema sp. OMZ 789]UTC69741.1 hypothetical protein E4O01_14040 [Treponema sp. OMZ 790]UTC72455.1 hypothetical protein E4O02_14130 [Treponema sp. OMZ 791]
MIYIKYYNKSKGCFLEDLNRKPDPEIEKKLNIQADVIYQSPHTSKITWAAKRIDENYIRLMVSDKAVNKIVSIKLEDEFSGSEIAFAGLNEENRIIVSFTAGQDGSQDYCIELDNNELKVIYKFPKNLSYMFSFDKYALLADFYSSNFIKISSSDFTQILEKTYSLFKKDSLSNIQKINDSFGIFCTTEGKCYLFDLSTLELIDELIIDCTIGELENSCGVNALFQTRDEMIFQYRNYKNGKTSIEWIGVDKLYLDKLIKEQKL